MTAPTADSAANRIRKLLESRHPGETRVDWARHYGLNANSLYSYLNGNRNITDRSAAELGRALRVSPDWILYGTPEDPRDADERRLLDYFRAANPTLRAAALRLLRPE